MISRVRRDIYLSSLQRPGPGGGAMFLYSPAKRTWQLPRRCPRYDRGGWRAAWHASGFSFRDMPRRAGLVIIVALAALTMYPPPAQVGVPDPQPPAAASKLPPAPRPSVTVEHQLIQVEPVRPPKPAPRLRRAVPSTRLAYGPTRPVTLVSVRAAPSLATAGSVRNPSPVSIADAALPLALRRGSAFALAYGSRSPEPRAPSRATTPGFPQIQI